VEVVTVARAILLSLLLSFPAFIGSARPQFSADSAYSYLHTLVADIGPRPMGSPAEQRALQFAVEKFRSFGCQETFLMPIAVAAQVNTSSGNAVGILKGKTDRIILIGGHIDSSGPDIPGANDDGSGAACVLELARVLSQRQNSSTIVFCCWGGEEEGLRGSEYFVNHFDRIDSVALMLQIDMADGAGILEIDPDYKAIKAPRWLTEATYTEFYSTLRYTGLKYPTASATINAAMGGATGSDHNPFLEKGIPAIDFTSDVDYPIHTPQDNLANFTPAGLKKSADLVLRLVERFDEGTPTRSTEQYMLVQLGIKPLFLPYWVLWTIIVAALVLAVIAYAAVRGRALRMDTGPRVRWSALKLFVFVLIIQTCIWMSETVFGFVAGYRFPWVNNFGTFALLGLLAGVVGLWFVIKLTRVLPLSKSALPFGRRSLLALLLMMLLACLTGPEFGALLAGSLLCMALAFLVSPALLRVFLWLGSVAMLARIVFFEELGLILRSISENMLYSGLSLVGYEALFIVGFTLLSMPVAYGFVAIYRDSGADLFWLDRFRTRRHLVFAIVPLIVLSLWLLFMTSPYDAKWYNKVQIEQRSRAGTDSSTITIRGSEYFKNLRVLSEGKAIELDDRDNYYTFTPAKPSGVGWVTMDARIDTAARNAERDSIWNVSRTLTIHSQRRPLRVQVRYTSASSLPVQSRWAFKKADRFEAESDTVRVFSWYAFPDTLLEVPVTFSLRRDQRVQEKVEVTYDTIAYPIRTERPLTSVRLRTVVTSANSFGVPTDGAMSTAGGH
jgi:hypothetical protein